MTTITRIFPRILSYRLTVYAFEFLKTLLWFTMLPVGKLTERLSGRYPGDASFNYQISIYQYYCLPFVGVLKFAIAIGLACAIKAITGSALYASIIGAISYLVVSGGIHLDGWMDTIDGLYAYGKDRYTIMREPTVGALGVIWTVFYVLIHVVTLSFILHDILTVKGFWPALATLTLAFAAAKANCFALLQYGLRNDLMKQDGPMTLEPSYPHWSWRITEVRPYTLAYTGILLTALALIASFSPHHYTLIAAWGLALAVVAYALNRTVIRPFIRELGFVNGDVFGASIALTELTYLILYVLMFVRG